MNITIFYKDKEYIFNVYDKDELLNKVRGRLLDDLTLEDLGLQDRELEDLEKLEINLNLTTQWDPTSGKNKIVRAPAPKEKKDIKRRSNPEEKNSAPLPEKGFELTTALENPEISAILGKAPDTWQDEEEEVLRDHLKNTTIFVLNFSYGYSLLSALLSLCPTTLHTLELERFYTAITEWSRADIESLLHSLQEFTALEQIVLTENFLGLTEDSKRSYLTLILQSISDRITVFYLSHDFLGTESIQMLCDSLPTFTRLEQLTLRNIGYGDIAEEITKTFMKALLQLPDLRRLDLSINALGGKKLRQLSEYLPKFFQLEQITLEHIYLDSSTVGILAEAFPKCPNLRAINLSENALGEEGVNILSNYLPQCHKLEDINLGQFYSSIPDTPIPTPSITVLAKTFSRCPNLRVIRLSRNSFGDEGITVLGQYLRRCSQLEKIVLSLNELTSALALRALVEGLLRCPRLRSVNLPGNLLVKLSMKELVPLISQATLTSLHIGAIRSEEDYQMLADALEHNTSITYLQYHVDMIFPNRMLEQRIENYLTRNQQLSSSSKKAILISAHLLSVLDNYLPNVLISEIICQYLHDGADVTILLNNLSGIEAVLNSVHPSWVQPTGKNCYQAIFDTETAAEDAVDTLRLSFPGYAFGENITRAGKTINITITSQELQTFLPDESKKLYHQKKEEDKRKKIFFEDGEGTPVKFGVTAPPPRLTVFSSTASSLSASTTQATTTSANSPVPASSVSSTSSSSPPTLTPLEPMGIEEEEDGRKDGAEKCVVM